jgi:tRNA(Arg) A34 adenosine deaminase TadA
MPLCYDNGVKSDAKYMREAIREACRGMDKGNRPYGSVLVNSKGEIVEKAYNSVLEEHDPLAHGETNVIHRFCTRTNTVDLGGFTLFATSEPCPMCAAAIGWANISRLVFGSPREDFKTPGYKRQNVKVADYYKTQGVNIEVAGPVLRDDVIKMYEKFRSQ